MGERMNFICVGALNASLTQGDVISAFLNGLPKIAPAPQHVMHICTSTDSQKTMSWPDSAALLNEPLTEAELLFVYFVLSNSGHYGRQSLSLTLHNSHHAVTLSLEQKLARQESDTVADILGDLTGIACTVFDTSVLVCGPELDLHGVENELDMLNIEKVLVKDLRCWTAICMRSFPRRERDFDLFTREPIA